MTMKSEPKMSIWRNLFDSRTGFSASLPSPLRSVVEAVQRLVCPYFGTCDDQTSKTDDLKKAQVRSVTFTVAAIVLSAKIAKADGQVTRDEVATFRQLFTVPDSERENVGRLFNQARAHADGFERYANQVAELLADEPKLLTDLLGCLITIAVADGRAAAQEIDYLRTVAGIFGIDERTFQSLFSSYSAGAVLAPLEDPYLLLGVTPEQSLASARTRYRELVRENHPDRLRALDLPDERIQAATERMIRLNDAWEQVEAHHADTKQQELIPA